MANASSKRIAAANVAALRGLVRWIVIVNVLTVAVRYMKAHVYGRELVPSSKLVLFLHVAGFAAEIFIWRWFAAIGTPRRNAKGDIVVGDDLAGKGVIELAWDVVYMTWICTLGCALLGNWVWYLYLVIPGFGLWKLWGVASPFLGMFMPGLFGPKAPRADGAAGAGAAAEPGESKKQAKLRARMERGDKRVQAVQRR